MCDILLIVSEVAYTHFGENVYREPAEERLPAGFSFCTVCGIIIPTKSTRPLEEAQQGGYLPVSPVLYLGMKKSGCQIGADRSPARLLTARTMRETHNPPVFRLEHRGIFFANKAVKLSILASFYINILISLSAHADFSVWALFFFVLRCTFVVFQFLPMRYTGCIRRDVL